MPFSACNCHGHALDCYYDPDVERQQASLNIHGIYAGGGVCINCQVSHYLGQSEYVTVWKGAFIKPSSQGDVNKVIYN